MGKPPAQNYILGLDIGVASVGAALLGNDHIVGLHVRAFDKAETAKEGESLNAIRRAARLTRRRIRRRAFRLLRLRRLLKRAGVIDSHDPAQFDSGAPPWQLRAEGLDRKLDDREWAIVLYHIIKHRGFQSNRKSEAKSDEKAGEMLSGVTANQQRMQRADWRTVGEMAERDPEFAQAKRNKGGSYMHTFSRADVEQELRELFKQQRVFGNPHTSAAFEQSVQTLLLARKPTLSGANLLKMVGRCTFETSEFRAPKASHTAERFLWLTRLNNLRVSGHGEVRALNTEERRALMQLPFTQAKLTYKQARKAIGLPDDVRFAGLDYWHKRKEDNELAAEDGTLFEAKAFHALRKAYESAGLKIEWQRDAAHPDRLDDLAYSQTVFKDDREAREWMFSRGIESAIAEAVLEVSFSDFIRLSIRALRKITPFMESGQRYDEAVQSAGYAHHSQAVAHNKSLVIPRLNKDDFPNPVVYRALNQARKLVNAIVHEYGPPAEVHIELARDLSRPFDERKQIEREQKEFQEKKQKQVDEFDHLFGHPPRKDQLAKFRLYQEQDGKCAYSLEPIDLNRLDEDGYVEIDHALPRSRSFDNSLNNQVLVLKRENQNKGNRTPYEYLDGEHDSERWRLFSAFVQANKKYRLAKRSRLLRKDFSSTAAEGFRDRNLTDTRYICRAFKKLVETHLQLADGSDSKRCVVVSGQLTAFLRARWGLIKVRENGDLHHALDAAVVAACTHAMVKRLSDYARRNELEFVRGNYIDPETGEVLDVAALRRQEALLSDVERHFPAPWQHFRDELLARLSPNPGQLLARIPGYPPELAEAAKPVRVSRAPLRRGLGAAHQETIRSAKLFDQGKSSVKTPLTDIKIKDLPNIVGYDDPRNEKLIAAIRQRLEAHGDDGKKAFKEPLYKPSKPDAQAPIIRTVNLSDTQRSGLPVRGGIANNGAMLRVDVFTDGKNFYVVPLYVSDSIKPLSELPSRAVSQSKKGWPVIGPKHTFVFSLCDNDFLRVRYPKDETIEGYYKGLDIDNGRLSIYPHDKRTKGQEVRRSIFNALAVEKYNVDMLGRLFRAREETRQTLRGKG